MVGPRAPALRTSGPSGPTHWAVPHRPGQDQAGLVSRVMHRKTKIVATLGPATDEPGVLDAMVTAGLDCARLNCSHGTTEQLVQRAGAVRAAADREGRPIA